MLLAPSGGRRPNKDIFTAVVDVRGVIAADETASADNIIAGCDAFEADGVKAVVLKYKQPRWQPGSV